MKKISLVLGGIRSGKSTFAEKRALLYSPKPVYIATAIPFDREMKDRIELHRYRRGDDFRVYEEAQDITGILKDLKDDTVLVDCLTLNLSNRLLAKGDGLNIKEFLPESEQYLNSIFEIVHQNRLNIILVSNEVGLSPVQVNDLGRIFQDLQGRWNCFIADCADDVFMLEAGIPRILKKRGIASFKIGAPSYVIPAGYIENVTYLLNKVENVELLLYDSMPDDPLFKNDTLSTLAYLQQGAGVGFTAHMQVKPNICDASEERLRLSIETIKKLNQINVSAYVFHYDLPGSLNWGELLSEDKKNIEDNYIRFFKNMKKRFPNIICALENTSTPLSALDRVVDQSGITYCIDVGHLLAQDWDLSEIDSRISRTSVLHLHGHKRENDKIIDHQSIDFNSLIFGKLESYTGILTIETFHPHFFKKSLDILKDYF